MRCVLLVFFLASCREPATCEPASLGRLPRTPAFAFVTSDYASSAIGFLDSDGELLTEAWIDSGSVAPRIVSALSPDAVLSSRAVAPCILTVIDRFGYDVLGFFDVCTGEALGQLDVGASFSSNPQDVLALDENRALVSRSTFNRDPPSDLERGNDVLLIDWRERRVLRRIDMSPLDTDVGEPIYARPQRMVLLSAGNFTSVVVGLARLSSDFMVAGPGAVAIMDAIDLIPRPLDLAPMTNCIEVDAVPAHPELAVVTCGGSFFVSEDERRASAGLALLELATDGSVNVRARWAAADHPSEPVFNTGAIPISASRVAVTAMGDLRAGISDRMAIVDFESGSASPAMEADSAFVFGDGAYDAARGVLLVPDAERGVLRRFDPVRGELDAIDIAPCRGLPPREVRPL